MPAGAFSAARPGPRPPAPQRGFLSSGGRTWAPAMPGPWAVAGAEQAGREGRCGGQERPQPAGLLCPPQGVWKRAVARSDRIHVSLRGGCRASGESGQVSPPHGDAAAEGVALGRASSAGAGIHVGSRGREGWVCGHRGRGVRAEGSLLCPHLAHMRQSTRTLPAPVFQKHRPLRGEKEQRPWEMSVGSPPTAPAHPHPHPACPAAVSARGSSWLKRPH